MNRNNKTLRSRISLEGIENGEKRALLKSVGFSDNDMKSRPLIGIANSWSSVVPGHYNLNQLAEQVKKGIYRNGGTVAEFGVISCCDGLASGESLKYILPSREIICNSVEIAVEAHQLDGIVLLASCDKIVPGMLMAAARLDIPAILVNGGPMLGGVEFAGKKSDGTSMIEAVAMHKSGKISQETINELENMVCPTYGSCSFLGTANTMCCLSEALGMSLPASALIPAVYAERLRAAEKSGEAICYLINNNITARDIITEQALENAVRVCQAIGGSTNAVLHLAAIAYEAEVKMNIMKTFAMMREDTPLLVKVNPAGNHDMEEFWKAGGIPKVMERLQNKINLNVLTCSGKRLQENLLETKTEYCKYKKDNNDIIRTLDKPFASQGGIAILSGNLAPQTAVCKPSAIDSSLLEFHGTAVVFDCEEEANKAILAGQIKAGNIVVIRYEGPKGGPGMKEMYLSSKYLTGMGLGNSTAVISDGRFSGTNNGCFVGHISPEAAEGGPLAAVENGDKISIDIRKGILHLHLTAEEIKKRLATWERPEINKKRGYLSLYARLAASAHEGAVIK